VSEFALKNLLSGFEFLSCIPGSIGGGIIMNSGCYGEDISKILISIETINLKGEIKIIDREKINFKYRGSDLPNDLIILSAKYRGKIESKENIQKKQLKLISKKKIDQPSKIKTCGSTFKNPNNFKAWQLIKKSNCDKMEVGEIKISEKHCNFFVNKGKGTSKEIEKLISEIKKKVYEKTGINLELEIKIIGTK
jgi:UDP-N-acetylmuramate dehydrogenase